MSNRFIKILLFLFGSMLFVGCIKNDLPFPQIQQNITELKVYGESRPTLIDSATMTATVYLEEWVDIENVTFDEFEVTKGGEVSPNLLEGTYDLSSPIIVDITLYQTYQWLVKAEQNIQRYFTIEGQIGESVIDAVGKRIIVTMPETSKLTSLKVTSMKLGPAEITTYLPNLLTGTYDFSKPVRVEVKCFGRSEEWTIYIEVVEQTVSTDNAVAWSQVIWAYGSCEAEAHGGFQYRKADEADWIDVESQYVTQNGGALSCKIPHLVPLTEYLVRAVTNEEKGNEITVTTAYTEELPDASFDQWWLKDGKIWCPWDEGGKPYWDTGNTGAATLGQSNVVPTEHTVTGNGLAAELNTKFVGLFGLGKLAAGSVYTGSFKQIDGTNGILDFGRPFTTRPTKLRGYYQYRTADIDYANSELTDLKGRPDSCHIYIALTDWTAPYEIRTNPNNRQLFNKDADYVIAYGELIYSGTMDDYEPFEIELDYRDKFKTPSYIQITCASSKYGDYFTGGAGAVLYVDEFSLDYDY